MTITPIALDTSVAYKVDGYGGIAFRLLGWALADRDPDPVLDCVEDHEHEEFCWVHQDEVTESDTWVRVVMIGDDQVHEVEYTDIHPLADEAYCHECGQVGCTHDGRN